MITEDMLYSFRNLENNALHKLDWNMEIQYK